MTHTFVPLLLKSSEPRLIFITSGTSTLEEHDNQALAVNKYSPKGWPKQTLMIPAYRSSKCGMNMVRHRILLFPLSGMRMCGALQKYCKESRIREQPIRDYKVCNPDRSFSNPIDAWQLICGNFQTPLNAIANILDSLGIISGQFVGGCVSEPLGKTKLQCISVFTLGGICEYSGSLMSQVTD